MTFVFFFRVLYEVCHNFLKYITLVVDLLFIQLYKYIYIHPNFYPLYSFYIFSVLFKLFRVFLNDL